jgi:type VI secretion system secreted protein Hcp
MRSAVVFRLALICPSIAFAVIPRLASADDIFLTIPGVQGDATAVGFQGSIDVISVSGGVSFAAGTKAPRFSDFSLTMQASSASPVLEQAVPSQHTFAQAVISFQRAGTSPVVYLTYTLTNVTVSSFSSGGDAGGGRPADSISLTYSRIRTQFTPQNPDGTLGTPVVACWDVATNRGC